MDRYLFRGKRVDNGEWIEGCLLFDKKEAYAILPLEAKYHDEYENIIPDTVGQCTGLKDKNGKLAFESDSVIGKLLNGKKGKATSGDIEENKEINLLNMN